MTTPDSDSDDSPLVEKSTPHFSSEDSLVSKETSRWDFLVLTIPFFGLQLAWTVQQAYGVPYLSSLGTPASRIPLFVFSGPVAGLIGPPIFAVSSEMCESPLGKRKPFIFLGGLGTILSLLFLGAARPLAEALVHQISSSRSLNAETATCQIVAGLSIYALNFSIQPLQLGLRASVVDHFAPHQQPAANLWISCFSAMGSVTITVVGLIFKPAFWELTVLVTCILGFLMGVVAFTHNAKFDSQRLVRGHDTEPIPLRTYGSRLFTKALHLPPVMRRTCRIQLVSWFAWFLVLHYTSALVSSIYATPPSSSVRGTMPSTQPPPINAVSRVALPFYTTSLATLVTVSVIWRRSRTTADYEKIDQNEAESEWGSSLNRICEFLIRQVWKPSLAGLAISLIGTCWLASATRPLPFTVTSATSLLLGANGIFFALANWLPYTLITYEASAQAQSRSITSMSESRGVDEGEDDTPMLLAVHNMAITVPQIVASAASWLLMQVLAVFGFEQDVVWIFVMCIPPALWATFL